MLIKLRIFPLVWWKKLLSYIYANIVYFTARSTVFEEESDGESEKTEDLQEGSCPALIGDTETERVFLFMCFLNVYRTSMRNLWHLGKFIYYTDVDL